jgi:dephospho-CoA kinase
MKHPVIIAFTGLPMAGKSTARETMQSLLSSKNIKNEYLHFGATEEVERRNAANEWEPAQANLTMAEKERYIRELWRAEHGMGAMATMKLPELRELTAAGNIVLIDNLYSDEERAVIKQEFGEDSLLLVAVAADWNVRVRRGAHREYRPLTEEELLIRDNAEVYNLHKAPTIALARYTIVNNANEQADPALAHQLLRNDLESRILPEVIQLIA